MSEVNKIFKPGVQKPWLKQINNLTFLTFSLLHALINELIIIKDLRFGIDL